MKLDEFLPEYNVRSQHSINVYATPEEVYAALTDNSFSQVPVVRFLMRLRGFSPDLSNIPMREALRRGGFIELCNFPGEEVAYGIVGQFWRPSGGRRSIDSPEHFKDFAQPDYAKAAWNFVLTSSFPQVTQLRTETRVKTFGRSATRKFRAYWLLVAPFSGLLRRSILHDVKRRAEQIHQRAAARS